jgi:hypothetical protein
MHSGEFGLQVRLPQGFIFNYLQNSGSRCDAGVTHSARRDRSTTVLSMVLDTGIGKNILTYMKTTISSKGQIVLPAEFRQMDRIEPGQEFDVKRLDLGDYRLVRRVAPRNEGTIDWLLACPAQGFFCSHRI